MTSPAWILSPFFLDEPRPALDHLAGPQWHVNRPTMSARGRQDRMAVVHRCLSALVAEAIRQGRLPVSVAGDCCAAIGVLAGLQRAGVDPVVVWLDAHGDFNTPETTRTGFIGGMPLAFMVGRGDGSMLRAAGARPVPESDVVLAGARDLDPQERVALEGSGVVRVSDIATVPDAVPAGRPLYVHLDPDVLDPAEAPATGYPTAGGPSLATLREVGRRLAGTGRVVAVSLTTWDLEADRDGRTG
ncbi:MAG TPA: arginase family protein, partial [Gemmatimonadales bacterium]|nr:arginase family protein [Gemmatimonadales bacterium]